ncbi:MAG: DUF2332 family protein [Pseudomonadota bacterium]
MSLSDAFRHQAESCTRLGSSFMGQLCTLFSERWTAPSALQTRLLEFTGDIGPAGASLPLRLAGGLHALVLSGKVPDLAALYPPARVPDSALWDAVEKVLQAEEKFLLAWVESPPQTNEVRRAAALMAGAAVAAEAIDLPLTLSELGASGGLNLQWDKFRLSLPEGAALGPATSDISLTPDWNGPLPPLRLPTVSSRAGVDLNPLDPINPADRLRLLSYLWPDQPERLVRTREAAALQTCPVEAGDAIDWLEKRLSAAPEGLLHLVQHTVAWQYFPKEAQARGQALMENAGRAATRSRALAWLSMESDGDTSGKIGALLTLRMWPGDIEIALGRVDFHGRWIHWSGTEMDKL